MWLKYVIISLIAPLFALKALNSLEKPKSKTIVYSRDYPEYLEHADKQFQLSLRGAPSELNLRVHQEPIVLLEGVPSIGVYGAHGGYPLARRLVLVEFNPEQAYQFVPDAIKKNSPPKTSIYATISGSFYEAADHIIFPANTPYNLIFHSALWKWTGLHNVVHNILMGIFNPDGIDNNVSQAIAFNSLAPSNVNIHDNDNLSPNNARFKVSGQRAVASFWSAAISPQKNETIITFHLLINDVAAEKLFLDAVSKSNNLKELLGALETISQDKKTIQNFVETVVKMAGNGHDLKDQLQILNNDLLALASAL